MDWKDEDGEARAQDLTQRGMDHARKGRLRKALRLYDHAIRTADHLPALMNRACAYYHLGDFDRAVRDTSWALEVDESRPQMWLVRGLARSRLGDVAGAAEDLTQYLSLDAPPRYRATAQRALQALEVA